MANIAKVSLILLVAWIGSGRVAGAREAVQDPCPRPAPGMEVPEPKDLRSQDGVLTLALTIHNYKEKDGSTRYCYLLADGTQSPTLRVSPGDLLVLRLKNDLIESESPVRHLH